MAALVIVYLYLLSSSANPLAVTLGFMILITAAPSSYRWLAGIVKGLLTFPVFAATFSWAFGLPLLSESASVMRYSRMRSSPPGWRAFERYTAREMTRRQCGVFDGVVGDRDPAYAAASETFLHPA